MHFTGTKSSPLILLLKRKNYLAQFIITEKQSNQINTHQMKQRKGSHDSQIVRAKENL